MAVKLQPNTSDETLPAGHPNIRYQTSEDGETEEVVLDALAAHINRQWEENKRDKQQVEREMLRMQEAINNQYDSDTLHAIQSMGGSEIFVPLTSMQCNAASSWLLSVLNPPGDKESPSPLTGTDSLEEQARNTKTKNIGSAKDEDHVTKPPHWKKYIRSETLATGSLYRESI